MESVGQKLRNARLRKKLTLEDVSAVTRINLRNLQAIEADDVAQMSSPFTYRSFARQFASGIGLNWVEIEADVAALSGQMPTPLVPGEAGSPVPPDVPSLKPKRTHRLRWALPLSSLGLTLGICSTFHAAWQNARVDFRGTVARVESTFQSKLGDKSVPLKPVNHVSPPVVSPQAAAVNTASAAAPDDKTFRIELSALENCWLSVVTDGKEVFSGVLQPAQSKILDGHEEARVRTGNAGGVEVNFNGHEIGTLGRRGEVRTVVFTKNGYEVLQPAAQAPFQLASSLKTSEELTIREGE